MSGCALKRSLQRPPDHQDLAELVDHRSDELLVGGSVIMSTQWVWSTSCAQVLPPAGVVDTHHRATGQGGASEGEQVLGDVVEQYGHVQRPVGPA